MSDRPWLPRLVSFAFGGLQPSPAAHRPLSHLSPLAGVPLVDERYAEGRPATSPSPSLPLIDDTVTLMAWTPASTSDPRGVRVLPLRPDSPWPVRRRPGDRVSNPFVAFPYRAVHLGRIMYGHRDA